MTQTCLQRFATKIEREIATRLVRDILDRGYAVSVHDGEEFTCSKLTNESEILDYLATAGDDRLYFSNPDKATIGWIWLVWGNGEDLISDYTDNRPTEAVVRTVLNWIES